MTHEDRTPDALHLNHVIDRVMSRRQVLRGFAAGTAALALGRTASASRRPPAGASSSLRFEGLPNVIGPDHAVARGYRASRLLSWGDPVLPDAAPFSPTQLDASEQERQFGYNNDFIGFVPLPRGSRAADRGLLCVNHEYTDRHMMWSAAALADDSPGARLERVRVEMAAHGHTIVEIARDESGRWAPVESSPYRRRITATTPMTLSGPVAGHARVRTGADPSGRRVVGTFNNCAGGLTPWGTVLIAEENFHKYFGGTPAKARGEAENLARYGIAGKPSYHWHELDPRFDVEREPNEANRFGWIVEIDPFDPDSAPIKRTALGRFKHEGATCVVNYDGRVVVYSGDDEENQYLYKFVSDGRHRPGDDAHGRALLDSGTLFVAAFREDLTCRWLPLVHGCGPLTSHNGFHGPADVLIEARRAAELMGATPMDRPEDVETNPVTGLVYVMLTNNAARAEIDAANPRRQNPHGHILEIRPPRAAPAQVEAAARYGYREADVAHGAVYDPVHDHAAVAGTFDVFLRAGDPRDPAQLALYHEGVDANGWFSCPDNCAFDGQGRIWIATDQGSNQKKNGVPDGLRACDTVEDVDADGLPIGARALTRLFYACPIDAELCGPCFTPDFRTLFVAVQHPGDQSTFDAPSTRWPAGPDSTMPPRPSVVVITKEDGGLIGS